MGSSLLLKYPDTYDFGGKKVLNIGCGFAKFRSKNIVNLDAEECSDADVTWDLSKTPLPFEDETFDFIIANHILEHVPNWWNCFEDCSRILKTGGTMEIWVPGPGSDSVLGFRDHMNTINHCSWWGTWGLSRNPNNAWAQSHSQGPASRMRMVKQSVVLQDEKWIRMSPQWLRNWMSKYLRNVIFEMGWVFRKEAKEQEHIILNKDILEAVL